MHDVLGGAGRPIDPATRQAMEAGFGRDFSGVRVHTDGRAARSAEAVGARAYAVGPHLVFAEGAYAPGTPAGRRLLAHELAHVVQGGGPASSGSLWIGSAHDPAEREAEDMAAIVAGGGRIAASRMAAPGLRRATAPIKADPAWDKTVWKGTLDQSKIEIRLSFVGPDGGYPRYDGTVKSPTVNGTFRSILINGALSGNYTLTKGGVTNKYTMTAKRAGAGLEFYFMYDNNFTSGIYTATGGGVAAAPPPPTLTCGPDVTSALDTVLTKVRRDFASWLITERRDACLIFYDYIMAAKSWDIVDLHNQKWITGYQPKGCALGGNEKGNCTDTVRVDRMCHYAGSVNYVMGGMTFRMCADFQKEAKAKATALANRYKSPTGKTLPPMVRPPPLTPDEGAWIAANDGLSGKQYGLQDFLWFVDKYKGERSILGIQTQAPVPNYMASRSWGSFGYQFWKPGQIVVPDRDHCATTCGQTHPSVFGYMWYLGSYKSKFG